MALSLFSHDREELRSDESLLADYPGHRCHKSKSYQRLHLLCIVLIVLSAVLSILCIGLAVVLVSSGNVRSVGYWNPTDLSKSPRYRINYIRLRAALFLLLFVQRLSKTKYLPFPSRSGSQPASGTTRARS